MFNRLKDINHRPRPFEFYTAETLWNDEHISRRMLELHLDDEVQLASRGAKFIDRSVEWMTARFDIGPKTAVADFGCGPGLYAARLAERGARVTGIDFSERSIRYARKTAARKNLEIDYILGNYLEIRPEKTFDLILMIFCDFCALSPARRKMLLDTFHGHLKPDGSILLDVCSLDAFEKREETAIYQHLLHEGFWSASDYFGFLNTMKYKEEKVVLDKYTIVEKNRIWEVYNWLQYFSPESLALEFEESGLRINKSYADVAGAPARENAREFAVVAGKL